MTAGTWGCCWTTPPRAATASGAVGRCCKRGIMSRGELGVGPTAARRLDALQHALWDPAMVGNVPATQAVVRIIEVRARVLGLVQTGKPKRRRCRQPQTVVLQDNDCRKRGCPDHT